MSADEIVRVLRIIEYVGPRAQVEATVARSIHGTLHVGTSGRRAEDLGTGMRITAATLGEYPEVLERGRGEAATRPIR